MATHIRLFQYFLVKICLVSLSLSLLHKKYISPTLPFLVLSLAVSTPSHLLLLLIPGPGQNVMARSRRSGSCWFCMKRRCPSRPQQLLYSSTVVFFFSFPFFLLKITSTASPRTSIRQLKEEGRRRQQPRDERVSERKAHRPVKAT